MKKKILYLITQSELGGAQKYVFDLAVGLRDEFDCFVGYGEQGDDGEFAALFQKEQIPCFTIPGLQREISLFAEIKTLRQLIKLIRDIKPDILHLNSSKISILGSIAGKICKVPKIVYTAHGWVFNAPLPEETKRKYKKMESFTAKFKHKIICVSEFDRQIAIAEKICPEDKLVTIHNGIAEPTYLSKENALRELISQAENEKFKITASDIIVGSVGNLYKNKGFEYLIQGIKILVDNGVNIKAIIIGEGEERRELENWIGQLRLERNVVLLGRINNASELLKAFDVYVCSSVKEGLSYTIIEAMFAGQKIIATDVGGNKELIANEKEGLIIASQSAEQIATAIVKTINTPSEAENFSHNAQGKAQQEFTIKEMTKKTKEIYNQ